MEAVIEEALSRWRKINKSRHSWAKFESFWLLDRTVVRLDVGVINSRGEKERRDHSISFYEYDGKIRTEIHTYV
jgi:hypothetical protein